MSMPEGGDRDKTPDALVAAAVKEGDDLSQDPDMLELRLNRIKIINQNLPDIGRWQKRLSETIYPPEVPGATRSLLSVDRLYIQELPPYIEFDTTFLTGSSKYEIMTRMGTRLFIGCELKTRGDEVEFQIYDFLGRMIIEFSGRLSGLCKGTAVKVSTPFGYLGSVLQGDQLCSPHYSIVNWTGAEVFTIHHPEHFESSCCHYCNCQEEQEATEYFVFTAATDFDPTHIGTIARHLPRQLKVKDGGQEDENNKKKRRDQCCGITFPSELEVQAKILLLGALFVLDYRLMDRRGREGNKKGKGRCSRFFGIHTYAVIVAFLLVAGLIVIFYYFGTHHHAHSLSRQNTM